MFGKPGVGKLPLRPDLPGLLFTCAEAVGNVVVFSGSAFLGVIVWAAASVLFPAAALIALVKLGCKAVDSFRTADVREGCDLVIAPTTAGTLAGFNDEVTRNSAIAASLRSRGEGCGGRWDLRPGGRIVRGC